MPWPCCCAPGYCTGWCSPGYPNEVTVDLQGCADDNCPDWADFDGTYVLPSTACGVWRKVFFIYGYNWPSTMVDPAVGSGCFGFNPWMSITVTLGFPYSAPITVELANAAFHFINGEVHRFQETLSLPIDCCGDWESGYEVAYSSKARGSQTGGYGGDLSSATCHIYASPEGCS